MQPVPLPAPFSGVDNLTPILALQPPYCANMLNFNINRKGCILRKGDIKKLLLSTSYFPVKISAYGDTRAFVATVNIGTGVLQIFDIDSGLSVYASPDPSSSKVYTLFFNKYLFFFDTLLAARGAYFNGTVFGALGYTGSGFTPKGGGVHNERAYMIQDGEAAYWYSGSKAISGACTKVDLSTIVSESCVLTTICEITIPGTFPTITYVAFVFSSGEVLFYSGTYPDGGDWGLRLRAKIGCPLNFNAAIYYQGDALIPCDSGLISMRDLFLEGSEKATDASIGSKIQDKWNEYVLALRTTAGVASGPIDIGFYYVRGVWDPITNRIIISFPGYIDPDSPTLLTRGSFYFVYNTDLEAWYYQRSFGPINDDNIMMDIMSYKNKNFTLCADVDIAGGMVYEKEGSTGFMDRLSDDSGEVGYDFDITSAPLANGRAYVQKVEGMDVILNSDLYAETSYKLIKDLGVAETNAQILSGVNASSLQKPFVNLGIEGSYVQYEMSGTTVTGKTTGIELYGTNVWIDKGQSPR